MDLRQYSPSRVLITRLSAIGDCLATIPLAVEAKRLWPECEITWLVDCAAHSLLERHAAIDRAIRIPKKWMKQASNWRELRQRLIDFRFDLALDPQGLTKSAMLGWLSGAKIRIGFDRSHARELAPWLSTHRITRTHRHMVDLYRELLSPWHDVAAGAGRFDMPVYRPECAHVAEQLQALGLGHDWLAMNIGAGWPTKLWPPSRFAEVGQTLYRLCGMRSVVFWAGDAEKHAAEQVVHALGSSGVLAPSTSLPELAEWIRNARLFLSSDTGPAHLAAAIGTPSIVLFGPTWGDECGPYGTQHRTVQSIVIPSNSSPKRRGMATAMNAIQVDEVVDAVLDLLANTNVHRAAS